MWCKRVLLLLAASCQLSVVVPRDLEILVDRKVHHVDSRENQGRIYYKINDITKILGLESREKGRRLTLTGARGKLVLTADRPLVRSGDQYVLLAAPAWKRRTKNWYVPGDFFTKALPSILALKLEKVGDDRYRVASLRVNLVQVRLANYPDHVRILFQPSRNAPVRVKEFEDYIQVQFGEYLVRPELPRVQPSQRIVSSLEFNPEDVYGTFHIYKGKNYCNFRELTLTDPDRKIVDVYGPPRNVNRDPAGAVSTGKVPTEAPVAGAVRRESPLAFRRQLSENVIMVDPGHGGEDYGVQPLEETVETVEKDFALEVADRVREHLQESEYQGLLTRRRDVRLSAEQRSSVGNYYRSKAYLSIHAGGSTGTETNGPVVYVHRYVKEMSLVDAESRSSSEATPSDRDRLVPWQEGQRQHLERSRQLAESIQSELNELYGVENEVVEVPLAVLAPITAPAVLIEAGFLTNPGDREKMASPDFQGQLAGAIVAGLLRFLK